MAAMKYGATGNGIDGRYKKEFRTLAELQVWVKGQWQGVEYMDGPKTFHTDYVRWTLKGATLGDLGGRGAGKESYWEWTWRDFGAEVK